MQVNVPLSFEFWVSQLASFKQRGDEVAEWLRRWTANPLGSARVGSNPIFVALPHWFYGVMVSTLDFESSDPSSNLGRTWHLTVSHPSHISNVLSCRREQVIMRKANVIKKRWFYLNTDKIILKAIQKPTRFIYL